MNRKPAGQIL